MAPSISSQHSADVKKGERFEFGKNWRRFLARLNDERISIAEQSLRKFLGNQDLTGKTFLDIGSGSGLFSLAARRLGAVVHSFDYDPHSVACTDELRRRYFPADQKWVVERGSALDRDYLQSLGTFDIVYSWGVLHHTGSMWDALENVKPLTRMDGQLFIAIYNDLGAVTDRWLQIKKQYNQYPSFLRTLFALKIIAKNEFPTIREHARRGELKSYVRTWTEYSRTSTRGMSRWHDWIDWIGGYPYECATIEAIVDYFGKDGFALETLESRSSGIGCNEFVFRRKAALGVFIDNPIPQSRSLLRQSGSRLVGPFHPTPTGYLAALPLEYHKASFDTVLLFRDGKLVGPAQHGGQPKTLVVAPQESLPDQVNATRFDVVCGRIVPIGEALRPYSGHMYGAPVPELSHLADNAPGRENKSPVFVFEDQQQLEYPHALHADIVEHGAGRFSHWGQEILISSSDNTDPTANKRSYRVVIAEPFPVR